MAEAEALEEGEGVEARVLRFHVGAAPLLALAPLLAQLRAKYEGWGCSFEVVVNVREPISHYVSTFEHAVCCAGTASLLGGRGPGSHAEQAVLRRTRKEPELAPWIPRARAGAAGDASAVVVITDSAPKNSSTHQRTATLGLLQAFLREQPYLGDELALRYLGAAGWPQSVVDTCVDVAFVLSGGGSNATEHNRLVCANDLGPGLPGYPDGAFWRQGHLSERLASVPVARDDALGALWTLVSTVDRFMVLHSGGWDGPTATYLERLSARWGLSDKKNKKSMGGGGGSEPDARHNVARGTATARAQLERFVADGEEDAGSGTMRQVCDRTKMSALVFHALATVSHHDDG